MKPYLIYILCTGHSGSTILQYLLASVKSVVGIGEVRHMTSDRFRNNLNAMCSCGCEAKVCSLWGGLLPTQGESSEDWYLRLVSAVLDLYPNTAYLIDTSKTIDGIQPWLRLEKKGAVEGVRLIYMVRDFRGWVFSDMTARRRKNRPEQLLARSMLSWWSRQKNILDYLDNQGKKIESMIVSYESLIFQLDAQFSRISRFMGFAEDSYNLEDGLKSAIVHDVFGNRLKNRPEKRNRLTYDDQWQQSMLLNLQALMMVPAWRLNHKLRYAGGISD